jgi:type IV pilus assembly protein PilF
MSLRAAIIPVAASLLFAAGLSLPRSACAAEPGSREAIDQAGAINTELALAYMREGNLKAAREKIDKALQQNARVPSTQMAAGFIYDRLGDKRKASSHFEQAIRLAGTDNPGVVANAAVYLCMNGERKRGEEYLLQAAGNALNQNPDVAYTNAGRCARADGRPRDAEASFREALALNPRQADALFLMAQLTHEGGNNLQARAFLERHVAVAPVSASSLWLGRTIELALGDTAEAARYSDQLRDQFPTSTEAGLLFDAERTKP